MKSNSSNSNSLFHSNYVCTGVVRQPNTSRPSSDWIAPWQLITSLKADLAETKKHLAAAKAGKQAGHRQKLTFKRKFQATLQQVTKLKQKIAVFKHKAVTQQRKDKVSTDDTGKRRAKVITTLEGRPPRYNDAIRFCCIRLLSHNIGVRHVSDGIKCVVVTLTDLHIDRLPSPSKMCDSQQSQSSLFSHRLVNK